MDLRKTLDSVVGTARWAASNPGAIVDLARNAVRSDDNLVETRIFDNGVVLTRYKTKR